MIRRLSLRSAAAIALVMAFCITVGIAFRFRPLEEPIADSLYVQEAKKTGAANLVSAIYLEVRLYDTLFELLVFSVAVLGVRAYLRGRGREEPATEIPESRVVRTSADLLFPFLLLLGLYLTAFGHLTPGGGFSGGVVAASGLLLCAIALGSENVAARVHEHWLERMEWGIPLLLLFLGIVPLVFGMPPFTDLLPKGEIGRVGSGGTIPVHNLLVGVMVFIGTWLVVHAFIRHRGEI